MLAPDSPSSRIARYRESIDESFHYKNPACAQYLLANLALEELVISVNQGQEPTHDTLENISYRLEHAAIANDGIDQLISLRARLLNAWIQPIVWSGIVNLDGLTNGQARRVAQNIGLAEAAEKTAEITAEAIAQYDEDIKIPQDELSKQDVTRIREVSGFINETTPVLLGARHNSAKQFALPSLAYDDSVNPDKSRHIDGFYYDNRSKRSDKHRFPYQVEGRSVGYHHHIAKSIPIINAGLMGNLKKSNEWTNDNRPFPTTRRLVTERKGKRLSSEARSMLDHISSTVFNVVTRH